MQHFGSLPAASEALSLKVDVSRMSSTGLDRERRCVVVGNGVVFASETCAGEVVCDGDEWYFEAILRLSGWLYLLHNQHMMRGEVL